MRLADEPDGRLVAPGRFLPAAERYGLIREIDRMVLGKVLALLGERARAGAGRAHRGQPVRAVDHRREMLAQIERALALARRRSRAGW